MFAARHLPVTLAFSSACSGAHQWANEREPDYQLKPYLGCFEVTAMSGPSPHQRLQLLNAKCMRWVRSATVDISIFVLFSAKIVLSVTRWPKFMQPLTAETRPAESHSILAGPYRDLITTETSRQLSTEKTSHALPPYRRACLSPLVSWRTGDWSLTSIALAQGR